MKIDLCKDCLYYEGCMQNKPEYPVPVNLERRIYDLFVNGYDCFIEIRRNKE